MGDGGSDGEGKHRGMTRKEVSVDTATMRALMGYSGRVKRRGKREKWHTAEYNTNTEINRRQEISAIHDMQYSVRNTSAYKGVGIQQGLLAPPVPPSTIP